MSLEDSISNIVNTGKQSCMSEASCKGKTYVMFPKEHKDITYIVDARALCAECPVQPKCLEYALSSRRQTCTVFGQA